MNAPAPPGARIHCPLCVWHYDVPAVAVAEHALAGIFGAGVMARIALDQQAHATEKALADHLATHALLEWVKKVEALKRLVRDLEAELREQQRGVSWREACE